MIRLSRRTDAEIDDRLEKLVAPEKAFSYPEVAASRALDPALEATLAKTYDVDRYSFPIGQGHERFERAVEALFAWRHFDIPWLETFGMEDPAEPGQGVATLLRFAGIWFLSPCRVVYTQPRDASSEAAGFAGFAYGTLSGHPERGEERFRVTLDSRTGQVAYEIVAFSQPAILLTRLGYPFARRLQRNFAAASAQALRSALGVSRP